MDILGIGFSELVFIFIIALMIFGPKRLPVMAAKAGKFVRDLRNMSQGFMAEWQREITAATRLEELEEARKELEKTRQELQQARTNVATEVSTAKKDLNSSVTSAAAAASSTPTKKETPASKAVKSTEKTQSPPSSKVEPPPEKSPGSDVETTAQPEQAEADAPAAAGEPENRISPFPDSPSSNQKPGSTTGAAAPPSPVNAPGAEAPSPVEKADSPSPGPDEPPVNDNHNRAGSTVSPTKAAAPVTTPNETVNE